MKLPPKFRADWNKQPFAISLTALAILIALAVFIFENFNFSGRSSRPNSLPWSNGAYSASIPIYLLICPMLAWVSGKLLRKSFIGGMCLSLLIAALAMASFIYVEHNVTFMGAVRTSSGISSPMMDLLFWTTYLLFMGVCLKPMSDRMIEANPIKREELDGKEVIEGGITNGEVLFAIALWGLLLSAAQTKIVSFFAVDRNIPVQLSS